MPKGSNFHRPYPPEFRREAVELVRRSGRPLRGIAVDLGISTEPLRMWMRQADVDEGTKPGKSTSDSGELRELRRRNRLLEQENEVLRRTAAGARVLRARSARSSVSSAAR